MIVINVETAKMARALIGHVRRFGKLRSTVARLNAALIAASHRLELHVDDVIVASMGRGTDSGFLRLAGLQHLRIWPLRLLRGAFEMRTDSMRKNRKPQAEQDMRCLRETFHMEEEVAEKLG